MNAGKKWYEEPLRTVVLEFPASNVAELDIEGIINETAKGGVNNLVAFSVGYYPGGTSFYQSKIAPHYPGLGDRDLVADTVKFGHKNGQRAMVHMSTIWGGAQLYKAHPEWAQRRVDGSPSAWDDVFTTVANCPNSGYRQYLNSLVLELSNNYDIDGYYFDEPGFQSWCNCINCQKKFGNETGFDLPTKEDWDSPVFRKFIRWRYEQISSWRKELYDLAKTEGRCIWFQGPFPLAALKTRLVKVAGVSSEKSFYQERVGLDWPIPLTHGLYMPEGCGLGDKVHFELYRDLAQEPLWWYGISLRYGQSFSGKRQMIGLSMMGQSPFDLYGLPETEVKLSVAEILANNGTPLFARYYPDRIDQEAWDNVYGIFNEIKQLDPYMIERESIKYAAVLFSQQTSDFYDLKSPNPPHLSEMKGFSKVLLQSHTLFDVITEENIDNLSQYKVLVLPNTSFLTKTVKDKIRSFVTEGGGVIASYASGMFDEDGKRTVDDDFSALFGIIYSEEQAGFTDFDVYMKMFKSQTLCPNIREGKLLPTGGMHLSVEATTANIVVQVLGGSEVHYGPLSDTVGTPTVLMEQKPSGGRVVYFALPIGNRYLEFGVLDHFNLIDGAIKWAAKESPPIQIKNAPRTLAVTAFTQPDLNRQIIHLVNSVRDEINQPIVELNECKKVRLYVKTPKNPARVSEAGKGELRWSLKGQELMIDVPDFYDHKVITIEY